MGWEEIDAVVLDAPDDYHRQRMIEISENLHRAELTALERSKLVAEWVELVGGKPGQLAQVSGGKGKRGGKSEAARQLGLERTDVRRSLKIAMLDDAAVEAAEELGLADNRSALLKAAKHEHPLDQAEELERIAAGKVGDSRASRLHWGQLHRRA